MSTYEYMMGMGTNESGIELGPGVSVPPDAPPPGIAPSGDLNEFVNKLKSEQGPFVYIDDKTSQGKKFVTWLTLYDPSFFEWLMKVAMLKMSAAASTVSESVSEVPEWVSGQSLRLRKSLWDTYQASVARIQDILAKQGKILSSEIPEPDFHAFMLWWKQYDLPGVAAITTMFMPETTPAPGQKPPVFQIPKKLFDFWKTTKGQVEPPSTLLGTAQSWFDWALDNWLWLAAGTAGGIFAARWYGKRKSKPVMRNPMRRNMREGWGQTLNLKSGDYELHPILPDAYVDQQTASNMRKAKKFRVSSEGYNLGELHRSSGKRKWRARSYYGAEKYGNSRAALLEWLKKGSAAGALASAMRIGHALPEPVVEDVAEEMAEIAANRR